MDKLAEAYFSYRDLLHQQEELRVQILKIFGTLGLLSPDDEVDKKLLKQLSPTPITSLEVRNKDLKLWEMIELFLSALDDKATVADIRSFLIDVRMSSITAQAINSAIKTHPELFEEKEDGGERFVMLRKPKA